VLVRRWRTALRIVGLCVGFGLIALCFLYRTSLGNWLWLSVAWDWYSAEAVSKDGTPSYPHAGLVNPVVAGVGAALLIGAALQQAATARRRHKEQTDADRQRRITESYSKAVGQLASDKIAERLGGIYTLERISRESPDDYWTVMETLAAFVRERASWKETARRVSERAYFLWQEAGRPDGRADEHWREAVKTTEPTVPQTDVATVVTVIRRRDPANREREKQFDLGGTDLRGASDLIEAHLEGAILGGAHLGGAILFEAHLEGADLRGAHLGGADLRWADLSNADLNEAHGDAKTHLPDGVARPAHWPAYDPFAG
jgi:hypothetical protein